MAHQQAGATGILPPPVFQALHLGLDGIKLGAGELLAHLLDRLLILNESLLRLGQFLLQKNGFLLEFPVGLRMQKHHRPRFIDCAGTKLQYRQKTNDFFHKSDR